MGSNKGVYEFDLRRRKSICFVSELEGVKRLLSTEQAANLEKAANVPHEHQLGLNQAGGKRHDVMPPKYSFIFLVQTVYESKLRRDPCIHFVSELEEAIAYLKNMIAAKYVGYPTPLSTAR